jgi:cold shock protein
MAEGTVKWFNPRKGYGFIAANDGRDIFVHYANISGQGGYKTLNESDVVTFDVVEGEKGPRAENVVQKTAATKQDKTENKKPKSEQ